MASPTSGSRPATPESAVGERAAGERAVRTGPEHAAPVTGATPETPSESLLTRLPSVDELRNLPVAVIGTVVVLAGVVLQLVAIIGATWFHTTVRGTTYTLDFAGFGARTQRGLAFIYFSWGAWVLLVLTLVLGVAACIRWRWARVFQVLGAIVGVLGAFVTIGALLVFVHQAVGGEFDVARHYTVGVYLAMIGLLATAIGSVAGGAGGRR